jgi:hypothetical protein
MAKSSTARRESAHTATPEELAEESQRAKCARAQLAPSIPDPALVAAVDEVISNYDDLDTKLVDGRWLPSTPAEIATALQYLAGNIDAIFDVGRHNDPSLHSLREHVLALESLVVGREVSFLADLDDDPAYSTAGRAEFQRLYQRFEEQRRHGEDVGLHQRLSEAEARLARLERRLDPVADYRPAGLHYDGVIVSRDDEDVDDPLALLWANHHEADGTRSAPKGGVMHEPLDDLMNDHLRPQTWAQMCDCLSDIAGAVHMVLSGLMELEDETRATKQDPKLA